MKNFFSNSVNLFLISSGIVGGAIIAIAVTPLVTAPPTTNNTVVNFDALNVGLNIADVKGDFGIASNGQVTLNTTSEDSFNIDTNGSLLPLHFSFDLDSINSGLHTLGHYIGLRGIATQDANNLYGRVGVEGRVTNGVEIARGFAGYLEYDPSLSPSTENGINMATLQNNAGNNLSDDYIRISSGIPWGFYTNNKSKFKDDITIGGTLTSRNEPIEFTDDIGPVSNPLVDIIPRNSTPALLTANSIIANDFVATGDLGSQFSVRSMDEDFNGHTDNIEFSTRTIYCPTNPTPYIRLGCGGYVSGNGNGAPYIGSTEVSTMGCKATARKPAFINTGTLTAYAYCWRP